MVLISLTMYVMSMVSPTLFLPHSGIIFIPTCKLFLLNSLYNCRINYSQQIVIIKSRLWASSDNLCSRQDSREFSRIQNNLIFYINSARVMHHKVDNSTRNKKGRKIKTIFFAKFVKNCMKRIRMKKSIEITLMNRKNQTTTSRK